MVNSIRQFDPWHNMAQLHDEISRLFDRRLPESTGEYVTSDWLPAVDVKEEDDRFVISADVPGVNPGDIEIHMENGILSIKGERSSEKQEGNKGYKRIERSYGSFFRRFSLPDTADAEKITAKGSNGVLEIVIPKHEKLKPRKISVAS